MHSFIQRCSFKKSFVLIFYYSGMAPMGVPWLRGTRAECEREGERSTAGRVCVCVHA